MDNQRFEELLVRELTGEISPLEREHLRDMIAADPALREEYDIFKKYWAKKEIAYTNANSVLERVKENIRIQEQPLPSPVVSMEPRRRWWTGWHSAAAVFLLLIGSYSVYRIFYTRSSGKLLPTDWQEKYTARGTRSSITLSDGSLVKLNADSRLKYQTTFDGSTREVFLTGEAFFTIAKDPAHPFIIHTDKMNIRVLGTTFNVRSYPGDASMETTLLSGSVEVTFPDRPADRIILKPKDKLVIGNTAKAEPTVSPVADKKTVPVATGPDTRYSLTGLTYFRPLDSTILETSWVDNKLTFRNEEFQSLARKMERWYGCTIVFDNKNAASYHFTGLFQKESIREALFALQLTENFQYSIKGSLVHIY